MPEADQGDRTVAITVVVPTYRRAERLVGCLEALRTQEVGVPFEVIVVDDGSPEPVPATLAEACGNAALIRVLRQDNAGPAAARNKGAGAARGDLLVFTDDDCRPAPGWLAALLAAHRAAPNALLGGHTINGVAGNLFSEASQDLIAFLEAEDRQYFASNNIACARRLFEDTGGFADGFPLAGGEDREFGLRWTSTERPLVFVPDALVAHHHDLTARSFWRQHANYGRGARHMRVRAGDERAGGGEVTGRHAFASLGWYARLVSWPVRTRQADGLARAGLLGVAQLAAAWGFVTPNRR